MSVESWTIRGLQEQEILSFVMCGLLAQETGEVAGED